MNRAYQAWQESHHLPPGSVDLAEAVMQRVTQKASGRGMRKRTWEVALLDRLQAQMSTQTGLVVLGAVLGIARLFLQMTSVLFT